MVRSAHRAGEADPEGEAVKRRADERLAFVAAFLMAR